MCGIAGFIKAGGNPPTSTLPAALLIGIEHRGEHATGYAYHGKDGLTYTYKRPVRATAFIPDAPLVARPYAPRKMLLHTRHATQGTPKRTENNHPIFSKASGLCLVHNGWVTNEKELIGKHGLIKDADVDSETVLRLIENHMGNAGTVPHAIVRAMRELDGVFACAAISQNWPKRLWIWRRGAPVWIGSKGKNLIVYASTKDAILAGMAVCRMKPDKVFELQERTLIELHARGGVVSVFKWKLAKRKPTPLTATWPGWNPQKLFNPYALGKTQGDHPELAAWYDRYLGYNGP